MEGKKKILQIEKNKLTKRIIIIIFFNERGEIEIEIDRQRSLSVYFLLKKNRICNKKKFLTTQKRNIPPPPKKKKEEIQSYQKNKKVNIKKYTFLDSKHKKRNKH